MYEAPRPIPPPERQPLMAGCIAPAAVVCCVLCLGAYAIENLSGAAALLFVAVPSLLFGGLLVYLSPRR